MTVAAAPPRQPRARAVPARAQAQARPVRIPPWVWVLVLIAIAVLAFVVRVRLLTQRGGLLGSDGYDDGVYYAAADALVHGRLPYRDFLLLQPPGTILALTPFAWFGSVTQDSIGVVAARLAFIAVGALNAVLVATIARRFGATAALLAGLGYAVFFPAAYAERSTLLEPLGTCALLVSVLLARRVASNPRLGMLLAGAAGGVALGMRIWYVVPVALIALFSRRSLIPYGIGTALAALAIYLPFLAASPAALVRQVVLDQLGRPRLVSQTPVHRMATVLGALNLHLRQPLAALFSVHKVGLLLGIALIVFALAALTVRGARFFPVTAAATSVVLLASPSFFLHYGALTAPWLVLTVSIGAARLLSLLSSRRLRLALGMLLLLAVMSVNLRAVQVARPSSPIPVAALRPAAQQVHGCITSDDPQILTALDVLSRDYRLGCTVWPDVTGYTYDRDAARTPTRSLRRKHNGLWQADVTRYLRSGAAVIVHRKSTGLSHDTNRLVRSGAVLAKSGNWTLHAVSH
jgi:hypothetical protein